MIIEIPVRPVEVKFEGAVEKFLKFDDFWRIIRDGEAYGKFPEILSNPLLTILAQDPANSNEPLEPVLIRIVSTVPSQEGANDDGPSVTYDANLIK